VRQVRRIAVCGNLQVVATVPDTSKFDDEPIRAVDGRAARRAESADSPRRRRELAPQRWNPWLDSGAHRVSRGRDPGLQSLLRLSWAKLSLLKEDEEMGRGPFRPIGIGGYGVAPRSSPAHPAPASTSGSSRAPSISSTTWRTSSRGPDPSPDGTTPGSTGLSTASRRTPPCPRRPTPRTWPACSPGTCR
jgi:hypothetical protein